MIAATLALRNKSVYQRDIIFQNKDTMMLLDAENVLTVLSRLGEVTIETPYQHKGAALVKVSVKGSFSRDIALSKAFRAALDVRDNWKNDEKRHGLRILKGEVANRFAAHYQALSATASTLAGAADAVFAMATADGHIVERTWESHDYGWGSSGGTIERDFVKLDEKKGVWTKSLAPELL